MPDVHKVVVCASCNKQQFVCASYCAVCLSFFLGNEGRHHSIESVQLLSSFCLFCDNKMNAGVCTSLLSFSSRGRGCVLLHSWSPVDDAKQGNLRETKESFVKWV